MNLMYPTPIQYPPIQDTVTTCPTDIEVDLFFCVNDVIGQKFLGKRGEEELIKKIKSERDILLIDILDTFEKTRWPYSYYKNRVKEAIRYCGRVTKETLVVVIKQIIKINRYYKLDDTLFSFKERGDVKNIFITSRSELLFQFLYEFESSKVGLDIFWDFGGDRWCDRRDEVFGWLSSIGLENYQLQRLEKQLIK